MFLSRALLIAACAAFVVIPTHTNAQKAFASGWQLEAGFSGHISGYNGDIGNKGRYGALSDTQWNLIQAGGGAHVRAHQRGKRLGWNFDIRQVRIQGADSVSNNATAYVRNLHFRNDMLEFSATADWPLLRFGSQAGGWKLGNQLLLQGGLALLHHAPEARVDTDNLSYGVLTELGYTSPGQWHDLRSLRTEGIDYAKWIVTMPIGFSWTLTADPGTGRPWHITLSGLWRVTQTDHLDDIHSRFADPWQMTPLGLGLSSQTNPNDLPPNTPMPSLTSYQYQQGSSNQAIRGNADSRDAYWTAGITVAKSLNPTPTPTFFKRRFRGLRVENKR